MTQISLTTQTSLSCVSRQGGRHSSPGAPTRRRAAALALVLSLFAAACVPKAEKASGPIADQVEAAIESGSAAFDHSTFDALLREGTVDGLVDYRFFAERRADLDRYLAAVAAADLPSLERNELMALLINAYNAYTIQSILDHPDVDSIRDIDGVWDTRTHRVGGHDVTLDNIEHNLLRPFFKDPRIHMAVNCASQSCAPLPPWAFTGEDLEQQLDSWTAQFFSDEKYTRLDGNSLYVSKLLDWYGDDFVNEEFDPRADSLAEFVAEYAHGDVARAIEERGDQIVVRFLDYDWSLNQAVRADS